MFQSSMFKTIGLTGLPRDEQNFTLHKQVLTWLQTNNYQVLIEAELALHLNCQGLQNLQGLSLDDIGRQADLVIVIGGDGNMLSLARVLASYNTPLIGINRGHLGFLTDINPQEAVEQLANCLQKGDFFTEERFLLHMEIANFSINNTSINSASLKHTNNPNSLINTAKAVNEVVIHPSKIAHMLNFKVFINDEFAFSQRADGLIIATPTGSTAYSLSAGGSIMTPDLNAIAIVPMFPHTLSSRPLIIDGNSKISVKVEDKFNRSQAENSNNLIVSCDSQISFAVNSNQTITIYKSPHLLKLLHLKSYNYYKVLSSKLGWQS